MQKKELKYLPEYASITPNIRDRDFVVKSIFVFHLFSDLLFICLELKHYSNVVKTEQCLQSNRILYK